MTCLSHHDRTTRCGYFRISELQLSLSSNSNDYSSSKIEQNYTYFLSEISMSKTISSILQITNNNNNNKPANNLLKMQFSLLIIEKKQNKTKQNNHFSNFDFNSYFFARLTSLPFALTSFTEFMKLLRSFSHQTTLQNNGRRTLINFRFVS